MHETQRQRDNLSRKEEELQERIAQARQRQVLRRREHARANGTEPSKRKRVIGSVQDEASGSDSDYLVGDYEEGVKTAASSVRPADPSDPNAFLSPAVRALMEQTGAYTAGQKRGRKPFFARQTGEGDDEEEEEEETMPKVIYVSRTHSQLSQFIGELQRTAFGTPLTRTSRTAKEEQDKLAVRTIALGSRKQMCVNPSVVATGQRLGVEAMNERCLELMRRSTGSRCRFLPSSDEAGQMKMLDYRDSVFAAVHDIEDAVELGRQMHTCPYFAARASGKQAHLITLPYNLLLNATARASLNVTLEGSIVIVDEAHNLIDTILAIHTVVLSDLQIGNAARHAQAYLDRFSGRLKGVNEVNLKKLIRILRGLADLCSSWHDKDGAGQSLASAELVRRIGGNADQVNLMELDRWLRETRIARKVAGYADKTQRQTQDEQGKSKKEVRGTAVSALHSVESFLLSLANRNMDGQIYIFTSPDTQKSQTDGHSVTLKYQLLNPAEVFGDIVQKARSVILAGGTMEPTSEFETQLFPDLDPARLTRFSCAHIIPPQNLMAAIVCKGARGTPLEFKYDARGNTALLDELVGMLANYCNVIPHGVVVFVPSYGFLDTLVEHLQRTDGLGRLSAKKRIFYEPKSAADVDLVLQGYGKAIEGASEWNKASSKITGALLFAVVGAKLSEGINFSDRLARAVIMVGMPFANLKSPELMERMKYVRGLNKGRGDQKASTDAGQELYMNLCMKAVNQSIGRAIRHRNDYAALLFLDARYARSDTQNRLPRWIRQSTRVYDTFGPSMAALGTFFREKRKG